MTFDSSTGVLTYAANDETTAKYPSIYPYTTIVLQITVYGGT